MARVCRHYEHKDFSGLLAELQRANMEPPAPKPAPVPQPARENVDVVSPAARKRASLMSNPRMRYAYSQLDDTIHDRECKVVKTIADEDFRMTHDFDPERTTCRHCQRKAIIRSAISDDGKYINAYVGIFTRMSASTADLKELIIDNNAQLSGIDKDRVTIKVHDDRWMILFDNKTPLLFHNNYSVNEDYQRIFTEGYHRQTDGGHHTFRHYTNIMIGYSWADHVVHLKAKALVAFQAELRERLATITNWVRVPRFSLLCNYYTVVDCNHRLGRFLRKHGMKYMVESRHSVPSLYAQLVTFRVRKWQVKKFLAVMDEIKEYSVVAGFYDYPEICEQQLRELPVSLNLKEALIT